MYIFVDIYIYICVYSHSALRARICTSFRPKHSQQKVTSLSSHDKLQENCKKIKVYTRIIPAESLIREKNPIQGSRLICINVVAIFYLANL